ncbi:MAG: PQQ-dependent sugar dehydrogenase [Burkholderiaceae bacterium]|nr:PQQ-dependent sugar dehydrogenase [Burkholderiaceae bacterium]
MPHTSPSPSLPRAVAWSSAAFAALIAASIAASGGGSSAAAPPPPPPAAGPIKTTVLAATLASPWGLAFLPDGRMLVTQKGGSMVIVRADGSAIDATLSGVPAVNSSGQGGLLDVALDPDFATDPWVYFSFSEDGSGGAGTALARGRLAGNALQNVAVIWRQTPKVSSSIHYGSRIVFRSDKSLFLSVGERGQDDPAAPTAQNAQNVAKTLGKVLRLNRDGSIPLDNPVFNLPGALPGLWSIGHRNPQGAALKPGSDELWITEHGPRGGDELNRVLAGRNYGWPLVSYGCPYTFTQSDPSCRPGGGTHAPTFEEPRSTWLPISTAPSGLAFYDGARFPEWSGNLFAGALVGATLWRHVLDASGAVTLRDEVAAVKALGQRIRTVKQGPDGWLYLLTDDGRIVRIER